MCPGGSICVNALKRVLWRVAHTQYKLFIYQEKFGKLSSKLCEQYIHFVIREILPFDLAHYSFENWIRIPAQIVKTQKIRISEPLASRNLRSNSRKKGDVFPRKVLDITSFNVTSPTFWENSPCCHLRVRPLVYCKITHVTGYLHWVV